MSGAGTKPFRKFSSLVRRKGRHETPYQTWEDEEESIDGVSSAGETSTSPTRKPVVEFTALAASSPEPVTCTAVDGVNGHERVPQLGHGEKVGAEELLECFYLGSYEMTGLEIQGRGCINAPAAAIWQQSQDQDKKPKRVGSWSGRQQHSSSNTAACSCVKPRYVKLVTGPNSLHIQDQANDEIIMEFNYKKISFVGTHPKHTRLFAFIAESSSIPAPFCHAFKCEDRSSAKKGACMLSDVFHKKIQELVLKSGQIEVRAEADATLVA